MKALFGNADTYTREELTTASDTFGVKVNEFIQAYGDDYRDELTELNDRLIMLETAIDNPNKLGVVRFDSIKRPATLDDYVALVQEQIYNLHISRNIWMFKRFGICWVYLSFQANTR
ncbi:hypothetical protein ACRHK7_04470 [Weissella tructae]|uniref:Uncharacterized protein n=2 Tax=Weissella TaxID=46255 RepID=A0A075U4M0_9LACO|nr:MULTISPECIES: hypothetical protein [Weissella]AIG65097.1 hypothetical protein WS08_0158 [Weissella tructae]AIM62410.1 hypothetical protein WS74_0158 [Weissella ceti]AIM63747.1 hypothetical protein WS105_0157 [Weissella ceti]ELA07922.1 hypothetical protein WCNC_00470 [Weissella ceti NC36]QVV91489.1 hypothetical protein KHQ32_00910 [Weissella tructae]